MTKPDMDAAAQYLATNARVVERRRFERLFAGGGPGPVRDAVAAYRNADGGFGHALEPDTRCPASQPLAIAFALSVLHETDAWDAALAEDACEWLAAHAPPRRRAGLVTPAADRRPRPPPTVPPGG